MTEGIAVTSFQTSAATPAAEFRLEPPHSRVVNYMWVGRNRDETVRDYESSVLLEGIDRMVANARDYPDTEFIFWLDRNMTDPRSERCVRNHVAKGGVENIVFRDLNDVPTYVNNPIFNPDKPGDIWARVDLARLLVIDHVFEETGAQDVYYADLDIQKISLDERTVLEPMSRYGITCGVCEMVEGRKREKMLENSFIGFREGPGLDLLRSEIIDATAEAAARNNDGWATLTASLHRHLERVVGPGLEKWPPEALVKRLGAMGVSEPSGTEMPRNEEYIRRGLNRAPKVS